MQTTEGAARSVFDLPGRAIGVLGTGMLGMGVAVGSYGEFTHILVERGVPPDLAGFGMTLLLLAQLVVVLPADHLTRTHRIERVAAVGFAFGAVGALLPAGGSIGAMLASRVCLGVGQGVGFVCAMKYVGHRAPSGGVATAQGLVGALFALGLAVGIAATPQLVAFGGLALPAIGAAVVVGIGGATTLTLPTTGDEAPRSLRDYFAPLGDPVALSLGFGNMATFGFLMVATTWYTAVFAAVPGVPVTLALVAFAATTVLGRGLGGLLAARHDDRIVVHHGLLALAASLGLFTVALAINEPLLLGVAAVGTALGFSVPFGPLFGLSFSRLADDPGVTLVVMIVIGNAGALVYPWVVGALLAGTNSYVIGFAVMTASVALIWARWRTTVHRV